MLGIVLVSAQSSLGRATFHARHEIWLYMPGMKIGFSKEIADNEGL